MDVKHALGSQHEEGRPDGEGYGTSSGAVDEESYRRGVEAKKEDRQPTGGRLGAEACADQGGQANRIGRQVIDLGTGPDAPLGDDFPDIVLDRNRPIIPEQGRIVTLSPREVDRAVQVAGRVGIQTDTPGQRPTQAGGAAGRDGQKHADGADGL